MEDWLAALRQEVDRLDDQIAELFLKRMEVTGRIGACKEELGLPLMDPRRELEVLRSAAAETLDEGRKLELAHLFETDAGGSIKEEMASNCRSSNPAFFVV